MKSKHPVDMMMFDVVTSDGDDMSLLIFQHGFKLNAEIYGKWRKNHLYLFSNNLK